MKKIDYIAWGVIVLFQFALTIKTIHSSADRLISHKNEKLQQQINQVTEKKNTLMLIVLEQRTDRPNKKRIDSLEVVYYLDKVH